MRGVRVYVRVRVRVRVGRWGGSSSHFHPFFSSSFPAPHRTPHLGCHPQLTSQPQRINCVELPEKRAREEAITMAGGETTITVQFLVDQLGQSQKEADKVVKSADKGKGKKLVAVLQSLLVSLPESPLPCLETHDTSPATQGGVLPEHLLLCGGHFIGTLSEGPVPCTHGSSPSPPWSPWPPTPSFPPSLPPVLPSYSTRLRHATSIAVGAPTRRP
jgi:hypothetical protein